jgi:hypothetical protein
MSGITGDVSSSIEGQPGISVLPAASAPSALPPPPYAPTAAAASDSKSVPPPASGSKSAASKTATFDAFQLFCKRKEISAEDMQNLFNVLSGADVGVLVDDSPSMNQQIIPEGTNAFTMSAAASSTRWSEATKLTYLVLQIVTAIKPDDGIDLYFMNRQAPSAKIHTTQEAAPYFAFPPDPNGGTPMLRALRQIFDAKGKSASARPYLLVVVCDGEPNDGYPTEQSIPQLKQLLIGKPANIHVSLAECTDNKESMDFLESWNAQVFLLHRPLSLFSLRWSMCVDRFLGLTTPKVRRFSTINQPDAFLFTFLCRLVRPDVVADARHVFRLP